MLNSKCKQITNQRDLDRCRDSTAQVCASSSLSCGLRCLLEPVFALCSLLSSSKLDDELLIELLDDDEELDELSELSLSSDCFVSRFSFSILRRSFLGKNLCLYSSRSSHITKPSRSFNAIARA
jgi:hypothetical protein